MPEQEGVSSVYKVRMDTTIPKLLVKVSPQDAQAFGIKNLGEVSLRKLGGAAFSSSANGGASSGVSLLSSALRDRVAVVNISNTVAGGEILMSVKLAEMLEVDEEQSVDMVPMLRSSTSTGNAVSALAGGSSASTSSLNNYSDRERDRATCTSINKSLKSRIGGSSSSFRTGRLDSAQDYDFLGAGGSSSRGSGAAASRRESADLMEHATKLRSMLNEALSSSSAKIEQKTSGGASARGSAGASTFSKRVSLSDGSSEGAGSDDGLLGFLHSGYHKAKRLYTPKEDVRDAASHILDESGDFPGFMQYTNSAFASSRANGGGQGGTSSARPYLFPMKNHGPKTSSSTTAATSASSSSSSMYSSGTSAGGQGSSHAAPDFSSSPGGSSSLPYSGTSTASHFSSRNRKAGVDLLRMNSISSAGSRAREHIMMKSASSLKDPPASSQSDEDDEEMLMANRKLLEALREGCTSSPPTQSRGGLAGGRLQERASPIKRVLSSLNKASDFLEERDDASEIGAEARSSATTKMPRISLDFDAGRRGSSSSNKPSPDDDSSAARDGDRATIFPWHRSSFSAGSSSARGGGQQDSEPPLSSRNAFSKLSTPDEDVGNSVRRPPLVNPFERYSATQFGSSPVDIDRATARLETDSARRKLNSFRTTTHYDSDTHPAVQRYKTSFSGGRSTSSSSSANPFSSDFLHSSRSGPSSALQREREIFFEAISASGNSETGERENGKSSSKTSVFDMKTSDEHEEDATATRRHEDTDVDALLRESAERQRESLRRLQETNDRIMRARREMDGWLNREECRSSGSSETKDGLVSDPPAKTTKEQDRDVEKTSKYKSAQSFLLFGGLRSSLPGSSSSDDDVGDGADDSEYDDEDDTEGDEDGLEDILTRHGISSKDLLKLRKSKSSRFGSKSKSTSSKASTSGRNRLESDVKLTDSSFGRSESKVDHRNQEEKPSTTTSSYLSASYSRAMRDAGLSSSGSPLYNDGPSAGSASSQPRTLLQGTPPELEEDFDVGSATSWRTRASVPDYEEKEPTITDRSRYIFTDQRSARGENAEKVNRGTPEERSFSRSGSKNSEKNAASSRMERERSKESLKSENQSDDPLLDTVRLPTATSSKSKTARSPDATEDEEDVTQTEEWLLKFLRGASRRDGSTAQQDEKKGDEADLEDLPSKRYAREADARKREFASMLLDPGGARGTNTTGQENPSAGKSRDERKYVSPDDSAANARDFLAAFKERLNDSNNDTSSSESSEPENDDPDEDDAEFLKRRLAETVNSDLLFGTSSSSRTTSKKNSKGSLRGRTCPPEGYVDRTRSRDGLRSPTGASGSGKISDDEDYRPLPGSGFRPSARKIFGNKGPAGESPRHDLSSSSSEDDLDLMLGRGDAKSRLRRDDADGSSKKKSKRLSKSSTSSTSSREDLLNKIEEHLRSCSSKEPSRHSSKKGGTTTWRAEYRQGSQQSSTSPLSDDNDEDVTLRHKYKRKLPLGKGSDSSLSSDDEQAPSDSDDENNRQDSPTPRSPGGQSDDASPAKEMTFEQFVYEKKTAQAASAASTNVPSASASASASFSASPGDDTESAPGSGGKATAGIDPRASPEPAAARLLGSDAKKENGVGAETGKNAAPPDKSGGPRASVASARFSVSSEPSNISKMGRTSSMRTSVQQPIPSHFDLTRCQIVPARRSSVVDAAADKNPMNRNKMDTLSLNLNQHENGMFLQYVSAKIERFASVSSVLVSGSFATSSSSSNATPVPEAASSASSSVGAAAGDSGSGDTSKTAFVNGYDDPNKGDAVAGNDKLNGNNIKLHLNKRALIPRSWRPMRKDSRLMLDTSELGQQVTAEISKWFTQEVSGRHVSYFLCDKASLLFTHRLTGEGGKKGVTGGPLGAVCGGHTDQAQILHREVFSKSPKEAVRMAFDFFGFPDRKRRGDWSIYSASEVSLAYRKACLKAHREAGADSQIRIQAMLEIIRAFAYRDIQPKGQKNDLLFSDKLVSHEIGRSTGEVEKIAKEMGLEDLEKLNKQFDEYILRQMRFKSEVIDEIARLHENAAYAILGVDMDATDDEIKKAYRQTAMYCHPDKGGDKADFQELNNAYEKIISQREGKKKEDEEQRRASQQEDSGNDGGGLFGSEKKNSGPGEGSAKGEKDGEKSAHSDEKKGDKEETGADEDKKEEGGGDNKKEVGGTADLLAKVAKAADEGSRFANTAAEFAQQVAEAAKTAKKSSEDPTQDSLTKSIAHSAIVLTLTVVKAVRVVGYASLDAASHALQASKNATEQDGPGQPGCAAAAAGAMSAGFEALNAASSCAQATEEAAGELQTAVAAEVCDAASLSAAAEKAAQAASIAANAAIQAAIAAAEAAKQTGKVAEAELEAKKGAADGKKGRTEGGDGEEGNCGDGEKDGAKDEEGEDGKKKSSKDASAADDGDEDNRSKADDLFGKNAAATEAEDPRDRRVLQRVNNHKLLQRLNAEILTYQSNIKQFLASNRKLIPPVRGEHKVHTFELVTDYLVTARKKIAKFAEQLSYTEILNRMADIPLLAPMFMPQNLAISVNSETRVLRMAAILDTELLKRMLDEHLFCFLTALFSNADSYFVERVEKVRKKVFDEIGNIVALD
ncbi:unnamed protein product [Amoebophrya sp. A25]|nr:unnamed protein product [Amoebophrya sp. A25]|eukprot:GSA25T00002186001.1